MEINKVWYKVQSGNKVSTDDNFVKTLFCRFCIRGLIPHVERQMRLFNDIVTNRKSRSLFSGAKRWFGQVNN
jgi:hypothetical protein